MRAPSNPSTSGVHAPVTLQKLHSLVRTEMDMSVLWSGGAQSEERRRLMNTYLGGPRGDERPGRSQVVSRAAYETVEWAKPFLSALFFSGPHVAEFQPQGPEDVETCEQRTEAANYIFLRQNRGYQIFLDALTDAMIRRSGWIKVWAETSYARERERYYGKTQDEIAALMESKGSGWEISAADPVDPILMLMPGPQGQPEQKQEVPAFDVEIVRNKQSTRIRVEAVPPYEVILNPDARSPYDDSCRFVQHRRRMSESQAIALGFDAATIRNVPTSQGVWRTEEQDLTRFLDSSKGQFWTNNRTDSERQIVISECCILADSDGDGISEWWMVFVGGDYGEALLGVEPCAGHPFAQVQVIRLPHSVEGLSLVETIEDIGDIETTTRRMLLDNLYFSVQGRYKVRVQGAPGQVPTPLVDLNQLANSIPGSWVYEWAEGALQVLDQPVLIEPLAATLDRLTEDRHRRTGISPEAMGIDPNAMSKTVFGAMAQQSASQLRLTTMAMQVGEGLKRVFELIDKCLLSNPTQEMQIRLRDKWIPIDPSTWKSGADAEIAVGITSGTRFERGMNLQAFIAMMQAGRDKGFPFITDENFYEAYKDFATHAGLRSAEKYVTDPQTLPPPEPQPPDPTQTALAYQHHIEQQKVELKKLELELDAKKTELQHERELKKMELENGLKLYTLQRDEEFRIEARDADERAAGDTKSLGEHAESLRESAGQIRNSMIDNPLVAEMASLRGALTKPRKVIRENGRIVGVAPDEGSN
mgnify:FL=1